MPGFSRGLGCFHERANSGDGNIVAIFLLRRSAILALKDHATQKKLGVDPVFSARKLGIKNAEEWDRN